jgi:predicted nuclease with TOPRIM domain
MTRGRKTKYHEPTQVITLNVPRRLVRAMDALTDNRSDYVVGLLELSTAGKEKDALIFKDRQLTAELTHLKEQLIKVETAKSEINTAMHEVHFEHDSQLQARLILLENLRKHQKKGASPTAMRNWLEGRADEVALAGFKTYEEVISALVQPQDKRLAV